MSVFKALPIRSTANAFGGSYYPAMPRWKRKSSKAVMLGKFFPRLESHMGYMKKYKATIDYLTQENTSLKEEVNSVKSVQKQLEAAKLKQKNEQLQRFIANIPSDMMREIQSQQRQPPQKGRYDRD